MNSQPEPLSRRALLVSGSAGLAGGALFLRNPALAQAAAPAQSTVTPAQSSSSAPASPQSTRVAVAPGQPNVDYMPVHMPNGAALPWKLVDGVKVFHLIAEEVEHEFAPGLEARCWGYNGRVHGPLIEAVEGDRVRFYVTNKLPEPTSLHWHGVLLANGMDGVAGLTQRAIRPGETFKYEFTLRQHGTLMYHPHHDEMTQMAMGMMGMFVVHPREPRGPKVEHDFGIMLSEWRIAPGARRPDPMEMTDFNVLTMNARAFPGTAPLVVRRGARVRIRLGNLSAMDHHSIHIHGLNFKVVATDGGEIPEAGQWPETTVIVPVGSTRTIEFVPEYDGDWAMHCHMTHHVMNQMGHKLPNLIGIDATGLDKQVRALLPGYMTMGQTGMGEMGDMGMRVPPNSLPMVGAMGQYDYITMGGMFTNLKVREQVAGTEDPGWYRHPPETLSVAAEQHELERDGIVVEGGATAPAAPDHGH